MEHLTIRELEFFPTDKVLSNWQTVSSFIYDESATVGELKLCLYSEVTSKNREMIVNRLTTRLISLMKEDLREELRQDIKELLQEEEGV